MRTEQVTVFRINELTEEVKERVIERYRRIEGWCWDYCDSDLLTERFQDRLVNTMFEDCKVHWSLSNCQGDGVMLVGEVDRDRLYEFAKKYGTFNHHQLRKVKFLIDYTLIQMVYNGYYSSFFNTVSIEDCIPASFRYSDADSKELYELLDELESLVKIEADSICYELETEGYTFIDSHYTDDYILEALEYGNYEFYADGRDF